jgi:hypothetical protein
MEMIVDIPVEQAIKLTVALSTVVASSMPALAFAEASHATENVLQ